MAELVSAQLEADGVTLTLFFDEEVTPDGWACVLLDGGDGQEASYQSGFGDQVAAQVVAPVSSGVVCTVNLAGGSVIGVQSMAGNNETEAFPVTNNSTVGAASRRRRLMSMASVIGILNHKP